MPDHARRPTPPSTPTSTATRDDRLESYKAFLRIPSISALPEHADDCRAAADWLADALTAAGLEHVEVVETGGHPVVYADWLHAPDAPTVIVYGHYDVQPVDPLDLWTSPPFEPVVVGDRILARGAADDKGQVHAHVMAAGALLATRGRLPDQRQVRVRGRGGVELGPPRRAGSRPNRDRLAADVAIISDTGFFEGNLPAITLSLRGLMYAQIDVVGTARRPPFGRLRRRRPEPGQRAGPDHRRAQGPRRPDPRSRASTTTSSPLSEADRAALAGAAVRRGRRTAAQLGLPALVGEAGFTTLERRGDAPDPRRQRHLGRLPGRGQQDDHPGPRPRQGQLPAGGRPGSRPDLRGVPGDYVEEIAPPGVTTTVQLPRRRPAEPDADRPPGDPGRGAGARGDLRPGARSTSARAARSRSAPASSRSSACRSCSSGSRQPDDNAHAPNEWMDLGNYETSIRTIARMLDELVDLPR